MAQHVKKNPILIEGTHFECQKCRACCMGEPGYVWVEEDEIKAMARYLKMSPQAFAAAFLRSVKGELSLKELQDGRCVLLGEEGCKVYPERPLQCRTFPFWEENVTSLRIWKSIAEACPGVGKGKYYSPKEIKEIFSREGEARE